MSVQTCAPPPAPSLVNEQPADAVEAEALLDRAFGPGRFVKVSERVRERAEYAPEQSFCVFEDGQLVGIVRMSRIAVGGQALMFLGPLAVEQTARNVGLGALLVERACEAARAAGEPAVLLVGDMAYFGRLGFENAQDVVMPGPVDRKRVLVRRFADVPVTGLVGPR